MAGLGCVTCLCGQIYFTTDELIFHLVLKQNHFPVRLMNSIDRPKDVKFKQRSCSCKSCTVLPCNCNVAFALTGITIAAVGPVSLTPAPLKAKTYNIRKELLHNTEGIRIHKLSLIVREAPHCLTVIRSPPKDTQLISYQTGYSRYWGPVLSSIGKKLNPATKMHRLHPNSHSS